MVPFWLKALMVVVFAAAMFAVNKFARWLSDDVSVWAPAIGALLLIVLAWFIERYRAKRGLPPL